MFVPKNEQGVIALFFMQAQQAGWNLIKMGISFPDAVLEKRGEIWLTEFEYDSYNFVDHRHDIDGCDLIVCWKHTCQDYLIPVIELRNPDWMTVDHKKRSDEDRQVDTSNHLEFLEKRKKRPGRQEQDGSENLLNFDHANYKDDLEENEKYVHAREWFLTEIEKDDLKGTRSAALSWICSKLSTAGMKILRSKVPAEIDQTIMAYLSNASLEDLRSISERSGLDPYRRRAFENMTVRFQKKYVPRFWWEIEDEHNA